MTVLIGDFDSPDRGECPMIVNSAIVGVIRSTLLHEGGVLDPGFVDVAEAGHLVETAMGDVVADGAHRSVVTTGLRASLRDLADLVASDPETATVEQVHEVALTLRAILDHAAAATASPR
ncbi:hypothetical protein B2J88_39675 [Rhodococcus sp. SRB_17]|nr:hypothetical protein [Rhodococcus sp. SRB_17]